MSKKPRKRSKAKRRRKLRRNTLAQDLAAVMLARRWADIEFENAILRGQRS